MLFAVHDGKQCRKADCTIVALENNWGLLRNVPTGVVPSHAAEFVVVYD